jgi:hypothetical protein
LKSSAYFDLIDAFAEPTCPICFLVRRDADRFLNSLLYEYVADPGIQRDFRASRGLCNRHAWQMTEQRGGNVGVAILCQTVLDEVLSLLSPASSKPDSSAWTRLLGVQPDEGSAVAERLGASERCMCCAALDADERRYVAMFAESAGETRLRDGYAASQGVCLPHFRQLLKQMRQTEARWLIDEQTRLWKALIGELELFRFKIDPRNSDESMGVEGSSWLRAIESLAGASGVFGTDRPRDK